MEVNVVNPFGVLTMDILYYVVILACGPALLWYEFQFRPKLKKIHDAYHQSGVEIQGLVTHIKVTLYRGSITRREMRYAYKVPGSDVVVIKDFVKVKNSQLEQRLFVALILPGLPHSGVPKFLVQDYSNNFLKKMARVTRVLVGLASSGFCVYVFGILVVLALGYCVTVDFETSTGPYGHVETSTIRYCIIYPWAYLLAAVIILVVGFGFAWLNYRDHLSTVPGNVWSAIPCSLVEHRPTTINLTQIDNRPIPIVEAVAILDDDVGGDGEVGGNPEDAPALDQSPMSDETQSATIVNVMATNEGSLPKATVVELV